MQDKKTHHIQYFRVAIVTDIHGYLSIALRTIFFTVLYDRSSPIQKVTSGMPALWQMASKYERKRALVSRPEYDFLQVLRQIEPDKYEVVPQVALVNVIDKRTNAQYRNELFRVCDYCFVDRDTFEPLLLVELNDSSHKRADRKSRDEKVAAICQSRRARAFFRICCLV